MDKRTKKVACLLSFLLICCIFIESVGPSILNIVIESQKTEEQIQNEKPKIQFQNTRKFEVCTNKKQLNSYKSLYMSLIVSCKDSDGNDILDADHVKYTGIDWMKKGEQTIIYTVTDDYGRTTKADCTVTLTDPLNTGH